MSKFSEVDLRELEKFGLGHLTPDLGLSRVYNGVTDFGGDGMFSSVRDLEAHVLGSVIQLQGFGFREFELQPEDFSEPSFSRIFEFLQESFDRQGSFDWLLCSMQFDFKKLGDEKLWVDLHYARACALYPESLSVWLPVLFKQSMQRLLKLQGLLMQDDKDVSEIMGRYELMAERLNRSSFVLPDLKLQMEETRKAILNPVAKLSSCYPKLNDLIGGFAPGRLYVVGARPGVGKTLVAMQLAWELSKQVPVAFFSLEMTATDVLKRVFAMQTNVPLSDMEDNCLSSAGLSEIDFLIDNVTVTSNLFLSDPSQLSVDVLRRFVLKAKQKVDLKVLFVDYLQLLDASASKDQRDKVTKISIAMKQIAKEFGISVVCLAQLNRGAKEDERPFASDLKESGQIEQDADVILLLSRKASDIDLANSKTFDNLGNRVSGPKSLMVLDVVKNRHGRVGDFVMTVLAHFGKLGVY